MNKIFSAIATHIAHQSGRPAAFFLAFLAIIIWAAAGPVFNYSDTWQLVINTGTTVVTFLMVFVIQNTQNRDGPHFKPSWTNSFERHRRHRIVSSASST